MGIKKHYVKDHFAHPSGKDRNNGVETRTIPDKDGNYKINGFPCREVEYFNAERLELI